MNNLYKAIALAAALPLAACGGNTAQTAEREPPKPREELSDLTVVPTGFGKTQTAKYAPGPHYTIIWTSEQGRDCGDAYLGNRFGAEATLRLREAQFGEAIRTGTPVTVRYVKVRREESRFDNNKMVEIDTPRNSAGNGCLTLRDVEFHWE